MGLSITVLGCSGTYAAAGNACSGYLVSNGTTNVYLDCGPGTLATLQRHIALAEIDAGPGTHTFLSSGDVDWFRDLGRRLLGPELDRVEAVRWA